MIDLQFHPEKKRRRLFSVLGVVMFFLAFGIGVFVGQATDLEKELVADTGGVDVRKIVNLYSNSRSEEVVFDQFWNVWKMVSDKYVDRPVDEVQLFYGAIKGMVASLDDPYSVYMPPKNAESFAKDLAGEFEGIGAEVGIREGRITIIAPLPGSPAEQAGVLPKDVIMAIDGTDTTDMELPDAVSLIRGEGGTQVMLTILREGEGDLIDIPVTRDTITVPTVAWEMKENNIAYLRISYFNQETWSEFDKAVKEITLESPRGVILDLRSNPGGFLETSVNVASEWLAPDTLIVSEGSVDREYHEFYAKGKHRFRDYPTVVLVDNGSASGSEIVAGALQDHDAATVVGMQTFGKGSVQDFEVLPDGSALKLTIARWYTPLNRQIDGQGIEPDVTIEELFIQEPAEIEGDTPTAIDKGLEKAIEILSQ